MIEKLVHYLRDKGEAASSTELAEEVLRMRRPPPSAAERLLESVVRESPAILRTPDGRWALADAAAMPPPLSECTFTLCVLLPERAPAWTHWAALGCTQMRPNGAQGEVRSWKFERGRSRRIGTALAGLIGWIGDGPLLFDGFGNQISLFYRAAREAAGLDPENPVWSLRQLARRTHADAALASREDLASRLGVRALQSDSIELMTAHLAELFGAWCEQSGIDALSSLSDFEEWLEAGDEKIDFSRYAFDRDFLRTCPRAPGVYLMRDRSGSLLYVGKAADLARRLSCYFTGRYGRDDKTERLHKSLYDIELRVTGSELEALLLEDELIKKHQPPVNTQRIVHPRPGQRLSRYPRILVLPASDPDRAMLYFYNPDHALQNLETDRAAPDLDRIRDMIISVFFTAADRTGEDERSEIAASWLSLHQEEVRSINMRLVSRPEEAVRLINDHLCDPDRDGERVLFY